MAGLEPQIVHLVELVAIQLIQRMILTSRIRRRVNCTADGISSNDGRFSRWSCADLNCAAIAARDSISPNRSTAPYSTNQLRLAAHNCLEALLLKTRASKSESS